MSASMESNWHYYVARVFMCGRMSHRAFGYDTFVPVKQAKLYSWDAAAALKCVPQLQLPKLPLQHRASNGGRAEFLDLFRCVSEI